MIKLAGGSSSVRVYVSPTITLPNSFSGYTQSYQHTQTHDLGSIPDQVDILYPGDRDFSNSYYAPSGPYGQSTNIDYGWNNSVGELGNGGASCFSKSTTQFKVVFQRGWSGQKVYFKAYILAGTHRAN
jgi:hypothetical protein